MNQPTMICKLVKAGQTAKRLVRYVAKKAIGLRADLGFGFMKLRRPMLSWAAEVLRANRDSCRRASEVRHVIFSVPKGMVRRAAIAALYAVFADWRTAYAPGRPWVAAVQNHNGIFHLHAAISNVDADGRPLKIQPQSCPRYGGNEVHDARDFCSRKRPSQGGSCLQQGEETRRPRPRRVGRCPRRRHQQRRVDAAKRERNSLRVSFPQGRFHHQFCIRRQAYPPRHSPPFSRSTATTTNERKHHANGIHPTRPTFARFHRGKARESRLHHQGPGQPHNQSPLRQSAHAHGNGDQTTQPTNNTNTLI